MEQDLKEKAPKLEDKKESVKVQNLVLKTGESAKEDVVVEEAEEWEGTPINRNLFILFIFT
jgi:hypothetical protein